jgi:fructose-specific phosphotransferase system IIA component
MKIQDILSIRSIQINANISSKNEAIDLALELANKSSKVADIDVVKNEVYKRENIMSTGIGKGIGLPHAKTNKVSDIVGAFVTIANPIDFNSLDNSKVDTIFLLLGQEDNVGNHLRILSKISRFLNNDEVRENLKKSTKAEEIIAIFNNCEAELS